MLNVRTSRMLKLRSSVVIGHAIPDSGGEVNPTGKHVQHGVNTRIRKLVRSSPPAHSRHELEKQQDGVD